MIDSKEIMLAGECIRSVIANGADEARVSLSKSVMDGYTFLNGEFLEFYPKHSVVEKFFLATEELHRLNGGRWKAFSAREEESASAGESC